MPTSSRPATKRIRADEDHSKASVKRNEAHRQAETQDEKDEAKDKEHEHEDEDWTSQPPFSKGSDVPEGWKQKWRQSCWCGKTAFIYQGDPLQSKICHCEDCQRLHGAPFQHSAIFKKDNVRLDGTDEYIGFLSAHGEVHPLSHTPTPLPSKISCRACGTPLFDEGRNMIMAFPPTFEWKRGDIDESHSENENKTDGGKTHEKGEGKRGGNGNAKSKGKSAGLPEELKAQCHIFYARRSMDVPDGLPKWVGHKEQSEQCGETD